MNYLAHAYLSFGNKEILLGNMVSDFVKGRRQYDYPPSVHKGIILHRHIDSFTDEHPVTKEAKMLFKADYRLYSGAFMDVVYDHFLANDTGEFASNEVLMRFSQSTYKMLEAQQTLMPANFERMFFYMRTYNWLYGYRSRQGTIQSFGGLVRRSAFLIDATRAAQIFEKHYELLNDYYRQFWKALKPFVQQKFNEFILN